MKNIKVFTIDKAHPHCDKKILGLLSIELLEHNLAELHPVRLADPADADRDADFIAIIYSDTPLVNSAFIKKLVSDMEYDEIGAVTLGSGKLTKCGYSGASVECKTAFEATVITDTVSLSRVYNEQRRMIAERLARDGAYIIDCTGVHIDATVKLGAGVTIYPNVSLRGKTAVGDGSVIYSYCDLEDTTVGTDSDVRSTYALGATIGSGTTVGPFACLRKGAVIGDRCRVGDFVEIKNSTLENEVKAAHLAYVGDSYVGSNTNIGCGVVFANYDGKVKRSVIVGNDVFIGCNTNLVAPLEIESGAYIAAGSTVTHNVPVNSLCIARARQVIKDGWSGAGKPKNQPSPPPLE